MISEASKKCPRCGLYNAGSAIRCDCGYTFVAAQAPAAAAPTPATPDAAAWPDFARPTPPAPAGVNEGQRFRIRAAAYFADYIVLNVVNLGVGFVVGAILGISVRLLGVRVNWSALSAGTPAQIANFVTGLIDGVIYFTLFEGLHGASPGKLILGLRVAHLDGRPCGLLTAFRRALYRLIDGLFFGLVAYGFMKAPLYQRLGDQHTQTVVVKVSDPALQRRPGWWWLVAAGLYGVANVAVLLNVFGLLLVMQPR